MKRPTLLPEHQLETVVAALYAQADDADQHQQRRSIKDIFAAEGESGFRDVEAATMPAATIALMKFMGWSPSCERSAECARSRSRRSI